MKLALDPSFFVVVTGASGDLGRHVVQALSHRGISIRGFGRAPSAPDGFPAPWTRADLVSGDGLLAALGSADVVVHAASDPFTRAVSRLFVEERWTGEHASRFD